MFKLKLIDTHLAIIITHLLVTFLLLKENVSVKRWLVIVLGFSGVLVITRPGIIEFNFAFLFVLFAAIFWSLFQILSRFLRNDGENKDYLVLDMATSVVAEGK